MSFAPPQGPPPPSVPEGWKPQYDNRYQTWFYVNLATGKSQWERPETSSQEAGGPAAPPSEAPPSYDEAGAADPSAAASAGDKKQLVMGSNNPYNTAVSGSPSTASPAPGNTIDEDAKLAAKLQAEEDARAGSQAPGDRGAASDYYNDPSRRPSTGAGAPSPMPEQKRGKGGFFSKLMGKSSSSSRPRPAQQQQYGSYGQQPQVGPTPPQGGYYGEYQQPQPGYGYGGYGYPAQGGYYPQQAPPRRGGGMGTAGAAALGVGGGLLGGMLLADAMGDFGDGGGYDGGGGDFGGGGGF